MLKNGSEQSIFEEESEEQEESSNSANKTILKKGGCFGVGISNCRYI